MEKDLFISDFDEEKRTVTIRLCGEIDHHSAVAIRREADSMLCTMRPKKLIIDLSGVEFMDSSGLGLIMGRYTVMERLGGITVLRNPCDRVKKILELARIDKIMIIEKTTVRKESSPNEKK